MPSALPPNLLNAPTNGTVTWLKPQNPFPGGPPALAKTIASIAVSRVREAGK